MEQEQLNEESPVLSVKGDLNYINEDQKSGTLKLT